MTEVDFILSAPWVLPMAPENVLLENHSVAIHKDKIVALLPTSEVSTKYEAINHFQLNNQVLMPGLVNAHTHAPMNLFRGLADDKRLMDWLNNHIWPAEGDVINAESVTDGCRIAIAEMLRGGTTCFNEMYFFPQEEAQVVIQEGIRACLGHTIMNVPTKWAQNEDEYIRKAKLILQESEKHDRVNWTIAPQSPYTNSDISLQMAKSLADEFDIKLNLHLHETNDEIKMSLEQYGKRPLQRILELGLLDERLIAVHMVHLTDEEIEQVAEHKVGIVHCPESNMKLASGFSPVEKMLAKGITVAIGTDGAASNNDLDMFSEMRTAAFLAKAVSKDPCILPANAVLKMATLDAAKVLGLQDQIGSIEKGKQADIIAILVL